MRICSLLPSATEIVFSLDLGDDLVAVTHECDFPLAATRLPVITRSTIDHTTSSSRQIHNHISQAVHSGSSIYELDQKLLRELNPEVILTQELCDVCAVSYGQVTGAVRVLEAPCKVLSLEPTSLDGILATINRVGQLTGVPERAAMLIEQLQRRIDWVSSRVEGVSVRPRVFAMEWLDPPFVGGHWVPEMVQLAGGSDGPVRPGVPSSEISWQEIVEYNPERIVLMPCGFNLRRTVEELGRVNLPAQWRQLAAVGEEQVYVVDASAYFNRPGPRIVDGLEILAEILYPQLFPRKKPPEAWQRMTSSQLSPW